MTRNRVADIDERTETARQAALAEYDLDQLIGAPELEAIVRLASNVCGTPMAAVNIVGAHMVHRLATVGVQGDCARDDSMCAVTITEAAPIRVPDASKDARFATNPFVDGRRARIRLYASNQLRAPDGAVLGTLCAFDIRPRSLTAQQQILLDDLARLTSSILELNRRTRLLGGALHAVRLTGQELERSNAALTRFAGQVSHDLKNPLNGVTGFLERLAELPTVRGDTEAVRCTTRAVQSTGRMNGVIDSMLDYASIAGRLHIGPVDLEAIVGEILDDLEVEIRAARARVTVGRLPTLAGDATQLRAVLQNLISNSLKYRHPRRQCRVQISGERVGNGWVIRVADNGIGIPPGRRYEALQMFTRLHDDTTGGAATAGQGIGLSTCRRIIEAHQGDIVLEDTPGGGTTVVFHLPLPETRRPADQSPAAARETAPEAGSASTEWTFPQVPHQTPRPTP